jgi:hypothetical protein
MPYAANPRAPEKHDTDELQIHANTFYWNTRLAIFLTFLAKRTKTHLIQYEAQLL